MVLPASEQMHMQWKDINIQERKLNVPDLEQCHSDYAERLLKDLVLKKCLKETKQVKQCICTFVYTKNSQQYMHIKAVLNSVLLKNPNIKT